MKAKALPRADQTIFLTSGKWSRFGASCWYQGRMNTSISPIRPIPDHFVDVNKMAVPAALRPGSSAFSNRLGTAETIARR
jgi:hypothetical protein